MSFMVRKKYFPNILCEGVYWMRQHVCSMCQKSDTCVKSRTLHWCFQYIDLLKDNFDMNLNIVLI